MSLPRAKGDGGQTSACPFTKDTQLEHSAPCRGPESDSPAKPGKVFPLLELVRAVADLRFLLHRGLCGFSLISHVRSFVLFRVLSPAPPAPPAAPRLPLVLSLAPSLSADAPRRGPVPPSRRPFLTSRAGRTANGLPRGPSGLRALALDPSRQPRTRPAMRILARRLLRAAGDPSALTDHGR